MSIHHVKEDIKRLARLASSIADAHTAAVFLPSQLLTSALGGGLNSSHESSPFSLSGHEHSEPDRGAIPLTNVVGRTPPGLASLTPANRVDRSPSARASIELVGAHSSSSYLTRDCRIPVGMGLLGWVAENSRPIHVAPFEMDSSSLGIYSEPESIKALVAVPITLPLECSNETRAICGVLMCDSRKALSFSKTQVKQLEEIALHISRLVYWSVLRPDPLSANSSWQNFSDRAEQLAGAIGINSVEVLRISIHNLPQLEASLGVGASIEAAEQFSRLVQQALPPHFPMIRIPSGELLIAVDNMMSGFFQKKFRALATRPDRSDRSLILSITTYSTRDLRLTRFDLDAIVGHGVVSVQADLPAAPQQAVAARGRSRGGGGVPHA
jgi:hypothetical protein